MSRALTYFTRANFWDEKQPDNVRWAYLEVHLQDVFELAYARRPRRRSRVTALGSEDKKPPFTHGGFGTIMQTARFQFQLGLLDLACVGEKVARKRWEKVSRMKAPPLRRFRILILHWRNWGRPAIGAGRPAGRRCDSDGERGGPTGVDHSRGLLLWAQGQKDQAAAAFREGASKAPPGMLRYLNQNALHVLTTR